MHMRRTKNYYVNFEFGEAISGGKKKNHQREKDVDVTGFSITFSE